MHQAAAKGEGGEGTAANPSEEHGLTFRGAQPILHAPPREGGRWVLAGRPTCGGSGSRVSVRDGGGAGPHAR